ncbi:DUF4157 domain-containing protein [Sphingosinicella sp. BN140058]|uniref:eCIS core domain-containing protein n=1 Tax=Sphingosinicella sp. BN140058 TaxID=1892855 RepID=UPI001010BFEB|nr:DUF4157 domain-containing protein [Sphingosinicella sp. BN140058]QAY76186.1 DUF4157 domain-containing protein [Sphingosinicella sp. BN140058]
MMLAIENTGVGTASGATAAGAAPPPIPTDTRGRPDVDALGIEIAALAQTDGGAAAARYSQAAQVLTPVEQGELLRSMPATAAFGGWDLPGIPDLPGLPSLPLPDLPGLPGLPSIPFPNLPSLPDIPNPIDLAQRGLQSLREAADAIGDQLRTLPHEAADALADSMRGDQARPLTGAERNAIRAAFGDEIDLDDVRIVDGPGKSPAAHAAFKVGGNPAITIGNTIYLDKDHYSGDLGQPGVERELLLHEFTHVVQYERLGYGSFAGKYANDLKDHDFDRNAVYRYDTRDTRFADETIEGQAEMVGDYARLRGSSLPQDQATLRDLEKRLDGTGIYGL